MIFDQPNLPATSRKTSCGPILRMEGISKSFSGVAALNNVRLEVARGEVHALMGENGAGKSTLDEDPLRHRSKRTGGAICLDGKLADITLAARRRSIWAFP